jgi:hypothetical protein
MKANRTASPDNPKEFKATEAGSRGEAIEELKRNIRAFPRSSLRSDRQFDDVVWRSGKTPIQAYWSLKRWRRVPVNPMILRRVLERTGGNASAAARYIGCSRCQLWRYLRTYNISRAEFRGSHAQRQAGQPGRDRVAKEPKTISRNPRATARFVGQYRERPMRLMWRDAISEPEMSLLSRAREMRGRPKNRPRSGKPSSGHTSVGQAGSRRRIGKLIRWCMSCADEP